VKRLLVAAVAIALTAGGCAARDKTVAGGATGATGAIQVDAALHERLPDDVRARGFLRLMTEASYAPMEQFAPDGRTIVGFEPDLASAIGAVLGVRVDMVEGEFQHALDRLDTGEYDGVLSSMTDTAEREKKADYVDYFSAGTSIIVQRGNPRAINDLRDLCGQTAAVQQGTFQAELLHRTRQTCSRPLVVHEYPTNADALLQLRTGRAAAVLNDFPPAAYLATDLRTRGYYQLASTVQYEPSLFGIAVAKDHPALRDALRGALDQLIHSGTYGELLERWGLTSGGLAATSINSGASGPP
jgi:polar amino acid transport system substrate-binding protein